MANEIIKDIRRGEVEDLFVLKLDIKNAYDNISSSFLNYIITKKEY